MITAKQAMENVRKFVKKPKDVISPRVFQRSLRIVNRIIETESNNGKTYVEIGLFGLRSLFWSNDYFFNVACEVSRELKRLGFKCQTSIAYHYLFVSWG